MASDRVPYAPDIQSSDTSSTSQEVKTIDSKLSYMDDIEYHRMSDFLDISYDDRKNVKLAGELSYLTDWASHELKTENRVEIAERIKSLKRSLGLTEVGPALVKKLYRWARLDQQRLQIEKEQNLIATA